MPLAMNSAPPRTLVFLLLGLLLSSATSAAPPSPAPAVLNAHGQALLAASVRFGDRLWDDRAALLWSSATPAADKTRHHMVRETAWYALGLMLRDAPGDRARSLRALDTILAQQIDDPGQPWNGTFFRSPEEPQPGQFSQRWFEYDPNWRQFIGTAFAVFLLEYPDRLSAELRARLEDSIRRAVEGEIQEKRLVPSYTNIAIMHGFLWTFAGQRLNRADWVTAGEAWATAVYDGFKVNNTFEEYNSPTYYGVDLHGLALWRALGPTDHLRRLGSEMEAALWRDIALFYHAGLRNMAGPFDRAYGMDMTRYVSLTGVWLGLELDPAIAPLPDVSGPMDHAYDFVGASGYAILGAKIPADALPHFLRFQGERQVTRIITPQRTATAWLGEKVIIGGEITSLSRSAGATSRTIFYPATIHWRTPGGAIGWIWLRDTPRIDARASKNTLTVTAIGDSIFRLSAPGLTAANLTRDRWTLPGLTVDIETDANGFTVTPGEDFIEVQYREATHYVLRTTTTAAATIP
jgi:hypothetical protein